MTKTREINPGLSGVTTFSSFYVTVCSPVCLTVRTFSITFRIEKKPKKPQKPLKNYRNPIFIAKEYARMLQTGQARNESDLARKIGVSRVRICQYLRLLSLDEAVIAAIEQLGDPMVGRVVTERRLRTYLQKTPEKQEKLLEIIASRKLRT